LKKLEIKEDLKMLSETVYLNQSHLRSLILVVDSIFAWVGELETRIKKLESELGRENFKEE